MRQQHHSLKQSLNIFDLFPLSVSSIGPMFSIAATGGLMAAQSGWWAIVAIGTLTIPFVISGFVFKTLNRHFPHAGASYHWSLRIMGKSMSRFQAWILMIAYFTSIPPIVIPAATYTLALVAPQYSSNQLMVVILSILWLGFATVPLLMGAKPTSNITKVFFILEVLFLLLFAALGVSKLNILYITPHFGTFPLKGFVVTLVVAATILDGWEIDSFAAEESIRPTQDPGQTGLIGLGLGLVFYAVIYPLLFLETPIKSLANSTDPLAVWSHRLLGNHSFIMLIPIIGSTAGGLWLTSYILTRALFAMGRDNLIFSAFAKTNNKSVPSTATLIVMSLTGTVVVVETFVTSLSRFFNLILASAGFFLLMEFFLDSLSCFVFLTYRHKKLPDVTINPHNHRLLTVSAFISTFMIALLLIAFFIFGPQAIGSGIDQTLIALLVMGTIFALATKRRHGKADHVKFKPALELENL